MNSLQCWPNTYYDVEIKRWDIKLNDHNEFEKPKCVPQKLWKEIYR